jgi:hypothetical protein
MIDSKQKRFQEKIKSAIADPATRIELPENRRPSFVAMREGDNVEIGLAGTHGENEAHFLICYLGIVAGEIIELRAVDTEFNPGSMKKKRGEKDPQLKASFLAYWAGTEERIGTVFPNKDGKGHRAKFRIDIPDGYLIELRHSGFYYGVGEQPKRRPSHSARPKLLR